ncbi:Dabb family protein [Bauldia litoralis]|uniref:Dabb family protein n=1 Tax=Bauldia litoralis TaxID=665467 RepID=UPI0032663949
MHTHTVFFWLKDDVDESGSEAFWKGLDLLTREPHVRDRRIGKPAATSRDVVDSTYACAIVLRFDDLSDHDAYQVSDEHRAFLDACLGMISRVQVYDVAETD